MSSANSKGTSTDAIASNAVVLDLALVEAASGNARRVTVDNGSGNIVLVDATARNRVGDNETTLGVTAERDLGVGAVGLGLLDELGHDRTTGATLLDVAGNSGFVIDTLDGDAVGTERGGEGLGDGRTDRAAEVLSVLSVMFLIKSYVGGHTPGSVEPRAKMKVTGAHLPSTMSLRVLPPPPRLNWRFSTSTGAAMAIEVA